VLQIVSIGVHQVDEIAKILGITRPLLDVTLADLHVKDLYVYHLIFVRY